ncbi:MAG: class II D-tagatose-bisphosphate aldolase, non-catalytic subunit [Paracoccus sp. (in: a-proteobacteria)]|uniref:class II D-tagatose-bisphosphate aldolase non-catalytic subunit n=1 Tax=Paracoccus sp. TaxID=267 RepID=UPI0026E04195|nr:class II D-tagatose-bisphosphate aldolase, non-catalytic subunit [Paracoccus sp. (in: a-proteobacteria)]MDO5612307.1 class II D-tagatose-bisphosphate aldolase, non-catalytic subunit [Paracoccus sp. (in: a-proteobacteria)]
MKLLRDIIDRNRAGQPVALVSVCSAHPLVLAAAMRLAQSQDQPLLIEATSNQVNQFGGYTGMRPADFVQWVRDLALRHNTAPDRLHFGGDHLGPQVWRREPAGDAMAKARDLMAEFVAAGFTKIHLDCSEGCAGEAAQVGDAVSAERAADLAAICEGAAPDPQALSYCFGTEVPPPGGARADENHDHVAPTDPAAAAATIAAHRAAFAARGLDAAWPRMVALVVQPGLEFTPDHVIRFDTDQPDLLSPVLDPHPGMAFEAHSTDYQADAVYPDLARRHFAVLKVGPALTFAMRRALYALDALARWQGAAIGLPGVMESLMRDDPGPWAAHYQAQGDALRDLLHFGYADRIRYYWTRPQAVAAVDRLMAALSGPRPAAPVLDQFFAPDTIARASAMDDLPWAEALVLAEVQGILLPYFACQTGAA